MVLKLVIKERGKSPITAEVGANLTAEGFKVIDRGHSGFLVRPLGRDIQASTNPGRAKLIDYVEWIGGALNGHKIDAVTPLRATPRVMGSDQYHYLLPGEDILVPTKEEMAIPSHHRVEAVRNLVFPTLAMHNLDYPRVERLLALFGAPPIVGADGTFQGLQENWNTLMGGNQRPDFYEGLADLGMDGYSNGHYCIHYWRAVQFLREESAEMFEVGFARALLHAGAGMHNADPFRGLFRGEKSGLLVPKQQFIGQGFEPNWSKQYLRNLIVWWMLTGSEFLYHAIIEHIQRAELDAHWQQVAWGERGMAWLLDSLWIGQHVLARSASEQAAKTLLDRIEAQMDADGLWSGAEGDHVAWMAAKLVASAARHGRVWMRSYESLRSMVDHQSFPDYPRFPDRYAPVHFHESHPSTHPSLFAWAARAVGDTATEESVMAKVSEYIGSLWADVAQGNPFPQKDADINARMGNQGPGWTKSVPIILIGALF